MLRVFLVVLLGFIISSSFLYFKLPSFKKTISSIQDSTQPSVSLSTPNPESNTDVNNLEAQIKNLEDTVAELKKKVESLSQSKTTTKNTVSVQNSPLYIPIGGVGSSGGRNFEPIENFEARINPDNYLNYTNMQLEASLKMIEKVGVASARLFNKTDGIPVTNSEISSESDKFVLSVSNGFKLDKGEKIYQIQVKSSQGFEVSIQNARIKINF